MAETGTNAKTTKGKARMIGTAEACAYLGVSRPTLLRIRTEGRITYYEVGRRVRYRIADLDAYLEGGRRRAKA